MGTTYRKRWRFNGRTGQWEYETIEVGENAQQSFAKSSPLSLSAEDRAALARIEHDVLEVGRRVQDSLMYHCTEVGGQAAAPKVREAASKAMETFSGWLPVPWPVKLRWFLPENQAERDYVKKWGWRDWEGFSIDEPVTGTTKAAADHIWIHAGRDQVDTVQTIAHELVHVMDIQKRLSEEEVVRRARELMQAFFMTHPL